MNISNLGRLVGAGLLALALTGLAPHASARSFESSLATAPDCIGDCSDDAGEDVSLAFALDGDVPFLRGLDRGVAWGRACGASRCLHYNDLFDARHNGRSAFGFSDRREGADTLSPAFDRRMIGVTADTVVAAVPEPQTWALMLAGFVAMLFMAWRKKRD